MVDSDRFILSFPSPSVGSGLWLFPVFNFMDSQNKSAIFGLSKTANNKRVAKAILETGTWQVGLKSSSRSICVDVFAAREKQFVKSNQS